MYFSKLTRTLGVFSSFLILAACGGGGGGSSSTPTPTPTPTPTTFTIGGTVSGLSGTGLVLQNSGGNNLTVAANGAFTFTTAINSGSAYAVTVLTQPSGPAQTCTVASGSGTAAANVTNVAVTCVTSTYTVSGTAVGLVGTGLVLQNNAGANLTVTGSTFTFGTAVNAGSAYAVTVLTQPSGPSQNCTVANGSGTSTTNVSNVVVTCATNSFAVSGTISGLSGSIVIQNNAAGSQTISASGAFAFPAQLSGSAYAVTVQSHPTGPNQNCPVTNGTGTVGGAAVTNVTIACTTTTWNIGGTVSGLSGTVVVTDSVSGQTKSIAATGAYTFAAKVASGANYAVTVTTQPSGQTCTVANGSGTVAAADVANINLTCVASTYTVGGTVSGLVSGGSVVLQNNAGDNKTVSANGAFAFTTPLSVGATYAVTKLTDPTAPAGSPAGQTCTVTSGGGTIVAANITSVVVTCVNNDTTAPTVSTKTPLPTTVGTSLSTTIVAVFNEALDPATVTASTFTVTGPAGAVAGTRVLSNANKTVTFTPTAALSFASAYTVALTTGVKDVAGNGVAATSWSFNTGKRLALGGGHGCARFADGRVKCWGLNDFGQLGINNKVNHGDGTGLMGDGTAGGGVGDGLLAVALGAGRTAVAIAAGESHTCAILDNGKVLCWGHNANNELGLGFNSADFGGSPGDLPTALTVNLGAHTAIEISLGYHSSCARLEDSSVKCWGLNDFGQSGQGNNTIDLGSTADDIALAPPIDLGTGRTAVSIAAGGHHVCAVLDNSTLKCWGDNSWGQLGYGDALARGDAPAEMGNALPAVSLGTGVTAAATGVGSGHACALTTAGAVRCFGNNGWGQIGINSGNDRLLSDNDGTRATCSLIGSLSCIGDENGEEGGITNTVAPGNADAVVVGDRQTCVHLIAGSVRCWGDNAYGQMGLEDNTGNKTIVGDQNGEIAALTNVPLKPGKTVAELDAGGFFQCVANSDGSVNCWGAGDLGQLGTGDTNHRGDDSGEMGAGLIDLNLGT